MEHSTPERDPSTRQRDRNCGIAQPSNHSTSEQMTPQTNLAFGQTRPIEIQSSTENAQKRSTVGLPRGLVRISSLVSRYLNPTRHQQTSFGLPVDVFRLVFDLVRPHLGTEGLSRNSSIA